MEKQDFGDDKQINSQPRKSKIFGKANSCEQINTQFKSNAQFELLNKMDIPKNVFTWPDYVVFLSMVLICFLIGVYFGFFKVSKNVKDYLIGGEDMTIWPVAISLVMGYLSAITFLGGPAEVYTFGIQFFYIVLNDIWVGFIGNYIYLPVFMDLRLTSSYEYLEQRFDKSLRRLGSFLFIITQVLRLPIVIYAPAMALNHVTEINTNILIPIVCAVCIFYTCVGGIRAVVWTDFLQGFLMICSLLLVLIKATWDVGGLGTVIERNVATERLEYPDMELSLTKRLTFPATVLGGTFIFINDGIIKQLRMQRYIALPTLKKAQTTYWIFSILKSIFMVLCAYGGLVAYATYFNCDPVSTKIVSTKDQLLPLLVLDTLKDYPGASGLFLSGVFSASLSTLSSALNSLAAVLLEDCFKPIFKQLTPKQEEIIAKTVVFVIGFISIGLASMVEKLGGVFQLNVTVGSISTGPLLGVFTLGILFPWANAKGAFYASLSGLFFMSWICFGAQSMVASGYVRYPIKPVFTDGCTFNITEPLSIPPTRDGYDDTNVFFLYRISFMLYLAIGGIFTIIFGLIISYFTGFNKIEDVNPLHLAPFLRPKTIQNIPSENKRQYKEKFDSNTCMEEAVNLLNKKKDLSRKEQESRPN
ncbi:sodium-coupled monocarboxylate transporter 1-like [Chrysoperla carnea]|uniref:sodium-coupled monocarboxylate transporter 1-like n=1 Tax=Chrysoperla carnea TaxID=189513 RepID=UPI001D07BB4D|nr:sodium-coupled monocarboxylate transporter 1-like [Chrysoperla carnea]